MIDISLYEEGQVEGFSEAVADGNLITYKARAEQLQADLETVTVEEFPDKPKLGCWVGCLLAYIICLEEQQGAGPMSVPFCQAILNNCISNCNAS